MKNYSATDAVGSDKCKVTVSTLRPGEAVPVRQLPTNEVPVEKQRLPQACLDSPIMKIEWRRADSLKANHYNPNYVFNSELTLLERSMMVTGIVQPILITPAGVIIDGFHRTQLAKDSPRLIAKYGGFIACAVLDVFQAEAKMLTVRMNRAKGTHGALLMSELVHSLIDEHGCDPAEVAVEIGATADEVALLYQESVFTAKNIKDYRYSKAWVPKESREREQRTD